MMGQASHFVRYAREQHPYSINRYVKESRRLLHVLNTGCVSRVPLRRYSIADIAVWPWIKFVALLEIDLAGIRKSTDGTSGAVASGCRQGFTSPQTAPDLPMSRRSAS